VRRIYPILSRALIAIVGLVAILGFISPQPAGAHAQLSDSNPKPDELLTKSPEAITLTFSVSVQSNKDSIKLFDNAGVQVPTDSKPKSPSPNQVEIRLKKLDPGLYIVNWSVVSEDSHPISGTFSFTYGKPSAEKSTIDSSVFEKIVLLSDKNIHNTQASFNRWILFVSSATAIAICLLGALNIVSASKKTLQKLLVLPIVLGILTSLAGIFIQNATIDNKSILSSISFTSITDQLQYVFGIVALLRIVAFLALVAVTFNKRAFRFLGPILSLFLIATITFSGHSASGDFTFFSIPLSFVHVGATSIWFGGLILALLSFKYKTLAFDFGKFSKIALYSVAVTIATGMFATWRQVGSLTYAKNSAFGQMLGFKIALVVITIILAFFTRKYLKDNQPKKMRKFIAIEAILLIGVLAFTSVLVAEIPSRTSAQIPVTVKSITDTGILEVSADPAKSGKTDLHVYVYDNKGVPLQIETGTLGNPPIQVTIENEDKQIGPISVAMRFQGLNHFSSAGLSIPFSGDWKITVRVQISDFDEIADQIKIKFL